MKFRIPVQELQGIVNFLGVTAKVNTVEVSGRILIEATNDHVSFLSNNMSTGISIVTRNVEIEETGTASIIFGNLKAFVTPFSQWDDDKKEGAKTFLFKTDEHNLIVSVRNRYSNGKVSNGRIRLTTYNAASILKPTPFNTPTFTLSSDAFKAAISKVLYAIDASCMATALRGMCIRFDENYIYFVGSDGKVLSEYRIDNECDIKNDKFIIKLDFAMGIRRLLAPDIQLEFELLDREIKMRTGDVFFWGRTIIGAEYPDYSSVLDNFEHEIIVAKDVLLSNLVPLMEVLDQKDYNRVSIKIENKKLSFFNTYGNFICDCDFTFNGERTIDVDGGLVLKTIDAIKDKDVVIRFSDDPTDVVIFDAATYNDQKALVVPLRSRM